MMTTTKIMVGNYYDNGSKYCVCDYSTGTPLETRDGFDARGVVEFVASLGVSQVHFCPRDESMRDAVDFEPVSVEELPIEVARAESGYAEWSAMMKEMHPEGV